MNGLIWSSVTWPFKRVLRSKLIKSNRKWGVSGDLSHWKFQRATPSSPSVYVKKAVLRGKREHFQSVQSPATWRSAQVRDGLTFGGTRNKCFVPARFPAAPFPWAICESESVRKRNHKISPDSSATFMEIWILFRALLLSRRLACGSPRYNVPGISGNVKSRA